MDCDADVIYQDENVCILNPASKRGVEVIHTVGYMKSKNGLFGEELIKVVEADGLKSASQLMRNKGITNIPTERTNNWNGLNNAVTSRIQYLNYDPKHFERIFLRPPISAPFKLEGDNLVSAGNWEDFLFTEREHNLFYGGMTYSNLMAWGASYEIVPAGLVTLRVDPDKTYVFYEAMKSTANANYETGMSVPPSWRKPQIAQQRFMKSRTLLRNYLNNLQANPGMVDKDWEIMVTAPAIPPCAFEKLIHYGDKSYDTPQLPEDNLVRAKYKKNIEAKQEKGRELATQVYNFIKPFQELDEKLRLAWVAIDKQMKLKKPKKDVLSSEIARIQTVIDDFKALTVSSKPTLNSFLKIQRIKARDELSEISERINRRLSIKKQAEALLATLSGGRRRTYKAQEHRRNRTRRA